MILGKQMVNLSGLLLRVMKLRDRIFRALLVTLSAIILGLGVSTSQAMPNTEQDDKWDKWSSMGNGYVARRRIPPNFAREVSQRKLKNVKERLSKVVAQKKRAKENDSGPKKLAKLNARIKKLRNKKRQARSSKNVKPNAYWVQTLGEGLYAVPVADIAAESGYNENLIRRMARRKQLTMTYDDQALAWLYYPDTDSIIFVGEEYDTFNTDMNAHHFSFGRSRNSKRINISRNTNGPSTEQSVAFTDYIKFEEEPDMRFATWAVAADQDADYWFWDFLFSGSPTGQDEKEFQLALPNPASSGSAQIRVTLRGYTNIQEGDEHQVSAMLNGQPVGSALVWDGFEEAVLVLDVDQSLLSADGNNALQLRSDLTGPGRNSGQFLDQIEVEYQRLPVAQNGALWLHNVERGVQTVRGFSSPDILVIRDPLGNASARRDITVFEDGPGSYSVSFRGFRRTADYLVTEVPAIQEVAAIQEDKRSNLMASRNAAQYLIIAPRSFTQTARKLRRFHRSNFSNVKIAWLDDIYDEFNAGREDPTAVTRFVQHARANWQVSPSSVVILGKGSLDHKDRMGYGDSFVPIVMSETPWSLAASDNRLLNGDEIADFGIGRLPIVNDEQGVAYVKKLRRYANRASTPESSHAVMIADNPDDAGDFHLNIEELASEALSLGFSAVQQRAHPDDASISADMVLSSSWEKGLVAYDGHGNVAQLGNATENFIVASQVGDLDNTNLPIFAALTCAAGDYSLPGMESVATALVLNPEGGSIAAYSPTGLSLDLQAKRMGLDFLGSLYGANNNIGDAVKDAKLTNRDVQPFMRKMYSVVGDPAVYAK